jgi:hypothetical protein
MPVRRQGFAQHIEVARFLVDQMDLSEPFRLFRLWTIPDLSAICRTPSRG